MTEGASTGEGAVDRSDGLTDFLEGLARWTQAERLWIFISGDGNDMRQTWAADQMFPVDQAQAITDRLTRDLPWIEDQIADGPVMADAATPREAAPVHTLLLRSSGSAPHILLGLDGTPDLRVRPELPAILKGSLMAISQVLKQGRKEAAQSVPENPPVREGPKGETSLAEGGVAHNFNNIIGAIAGFSATASLYAPPGSPIANNLAEIQVAVQRARALVMEVLDRGRWPESPSAVVDVERLLAETASLLESSLPTNVKLHIGSSRELGLVRGRYAALQQVFMNLCNNAAQAMPQGGRILCLGGRANLRRPLQLSHVTLAPGKYKTVSICDEGVGISAEALPRLFDPFFTTRSGGTGLGLSTAASIVEEHGGAIDVVSAPGQGSRFTIWLPAEMEGLGLVKGVRPGAGEIVLLISPATERLESDEEIIAALGYEARAHTDLSTVHTLRDMADVVLIAGFDAEEAAGAVQALRAADWSGPVLQALRTPAPNAVGALRYPVRPAELAEALSAVLSAHAGDAGSAGGRGAVTGLRRKLRELGSRRPGVGLKLARRFDPRGRRTGAPAKLAPKVVLRGALVALVATLPFWEAPVQVGTVQVAHTAVPQPIHRAVSMHLARSNPPPMLMSLQSPADAATQPRLLAEKASVASATRRRVSRAPSTPPVRLAARFAHASRRPATAGPAGPRAPTPPVLAVEPRLELASVVTAVCREYDGSGWRDLPTTTAPDCIRRGLVDHAAAYVQFGDHIVSQGRGGFVIAERAPLSATSARAPGPPPPSRPGSVQPAAPTTVTTWREAETTLTSMTTAICRSFEGARWTDIGVMTSARCLRQGFAHPGVADLQFGMSLLERRGGQIGVLGGGAWRPIQEPAHEAALKLVDASAPIRSAVTICRRFDGERWRDLANSTPDDCIKRAFAEPGTGNVQSGQWVFSRRANRVGVVQDGVWRPVATLVEQNAERIHLSLRTTSRGETFGLQAALP